MAQFKKQLYEGDKKVRRKKHQKWSYGLNGNGRINITNFLEYYVQRRNISGNVLHAAAATVSFSDPEEIEIGDSELDGESKHYDQNVEGRSSKEEQPTRNKRGKRQELTAVDTDQQYLESLKEIGKRMEETSNDSDRTSLLSLLPAMKQLSQIIRTSGSRSKKPFGEKRDVIQLEKQSRQRIQACRQHP